MKSFSFWVACIMLMTRRSQAGDDNDGSIVWKCDDLTPELCDLEMEMGNIKVKGIPVTYWKYFSSEHDNTNSQKLPIVAIHGGPGFTHNYMLPLKQQACRGRTIVFYDQAGCGESTPAANFSVAHDYPWLLDASYYATMELPALMGHLGWEKFHIIGNSWGTMLSQLYALDAPQAQTSLASMVLSGPLSDSQFYIQQQWDQDDGCLGSLPPYTQQQIHKLEARGAYNSTEYKAIEQVLTTFFTLRTYPAPDCFAASEAGSNEEVYVGMQGASEFTISGSLEHFNVTGRLHEIQVPVLLSSGKYDTMRPAVVDIMYRELPKAEKLFLTKSGHVSMIDEPGKMNDAIADFFDRVEQSLSSTSSKSKPFVPQCETTDKVYSGVPLLNKPAIAFSLASLVVGYCLGEWNVRRRSNKLQYQKI